MDPKYFSKFIEYMLSYNKLNTGKITFTIHFPMSPKIYPQKYIE